MKDQGCSPTGLHQFSGHVLPSSPSLLRQEAPSYSSQYNYHTASQGHPSLEGHAFEAPCHVTRQDQPACTRPYAQPSSVMDAGKISVTEGRKVSRQDIQLVQNLIERCLQLYMNRKEVFETLLLQAKIEPGFTDIVWQKLEEENGEIFKAYHVRLMVKNQITIFNKLLREQVNLMQKLHLSRAPHMEIPNGSHAASLQQKPTVCYAAEQTRILASDQLHHATIPPESLVKGTNSIRQHTDVNEELSAHTGGMDISQHLFSHQKKHLATVQGSNDIVIKTEPECSSSSMFTFGADNVSEACLAIGDDPIVGFGSIDSNASSLPEFPDAMGFLSQIPQNFSLSDLTAGFSHGSDILQNYPGCPYLANSNWFLDSLEGLAS